MVGAILFGGSVLIVTAGVVWFHILRPILEDYGVIRVEVESESVKDSQAAESPTQVLQKPDQPDRPADRLSVSAQVEEPPRLQLDKTRVALIEELLTLGWTMTDFRRERIFRGDNNEISAEVEAARKRLGIETGDYRTPVADRPTAAQFTPDLHR